LASNLLTLDVMNGAHDDSRQPPVTLQHIERPGLSSSLTAEIDGGGALVLVGSDQGPGAGNGGAAHDYRITVRAEEVGPLSEVLHRTLHDGHHGSTDLLVLLANAFSTGTFASAQEFRSWAHRAGIESSLEVHR
jgi:hypothetical protein